MPDALVFILDRASQRTKKHPAKKLCRVSLSSIQFSFPKGSLRNPHGIWQPVYLPSRRLA